MSRRTTKQRRAARRRNRWIANLAEARLLYPNLLPADAVWCLLYGRAVRTIFAAPCRRWFSLRESPAVQRPEWTLP